MLSRTALVTLLAASVAASPIPQHASQCLGCGKAQTPGYDNKPRTIESGGRTRSFKIQVPENYNAHSSYPLIIDFDGSWLVPGYRTIMTSHGPTRTYGLDLFPIHHFFKKERVLTASQHGRGGTSDLQRDTSLYYDYAAASDYIVVYPQGIACDQGTAWQGPTYACPDVNDIDFVADLLTYLEDNFCIDKNRIYASGKSNGGGFVDTLACSDVGDKFAAFAMAAAALYSDTSLGSCNKKRAILEAHGDSDHTISSAGGEALGGPIPNIEDWVSWWGERDCGAGEVSTCVEQKEGYQIETLSCTGGLSDVVTHYQLDAPAAHCWPNAQGDNYDAKKYPQGCGNSRDLDFTAVVLEFFPKWNLENAP